MKKSILVTGLAGSGKSATAKELINLGYEAYDIESIKGMFDHIDKDTGRVIKERHRNSFESVRHSKWICNIKKLKKLIKNQDNKIAYYFGIGSNMEEIIPLFDEAYVLSVSPSKIHRRLSKRHRGEYGFSKKVQNWILNGKDQWENKMVLQGARVLNESGSIKNTATLILINSSNYQ